MQVLPSYARAVAADLRGIEEQPGATSEPQTPDLDDLAPGLASLSAAAAEARLADAVLCTALKVGIAGVVCLLSVNSHCL